MSFNSITYDAFLDLFTGYFDVEISDVKDNYFLESFMGCDFFQLTHVRVDGVQRIKMYSKDLNHTINACMRFTNYNEDESRFEIWFD